MELTETGTSVSLLQTELANLHLFAANGKWKRRTSIYLLKTEAELCFP